jgi:hypothetical protein
MAYNKYALEEMSQVRARTHTHTHTRAWTRGNKICMQSCYRVKDASRDERVILCHARQNCKPRPHGYQQHPTQAICIHTAG